jgi:hypothetical protein
MDWDRLWKLTDGLTAVSDAVDRLDAKNDPGGDLTGDWRLEDVRGELPGNFEGGEEYVQELLGILVSHGILSLRRSPDGPRWSAAEADDDARENRQG